MIEKARSKLDFLLWEVTYWPFYVLFAVMETIYTAVRGAWDDAWGGGERGNHQGGGGKKS
jgi:hypothetical protein